MLLIVMLLPLTPSVFAYAPSAELGGINDWIQVTSPNHTFDWSGYGKIWTERFNFSYGPYMHIYKLNVQKGAEYTLYMKMPLNEGYMNINVTGVNPLSDDYTIPSGTMTGFVMYFQQPWAPRDENIDVIRKTFKIDSNSESEVLYMVCSFENPGKSFEFMLKTPKDPDDDVKDSTVNPFVPSRNGYTWGSVWGSPLYIEAGMESSTELNTGTVIGDDSPYYPDHTDTSHTGFETTVTTTSLSDVSLLSLNTEYSYLSSHEVDTLKLNEMYHDDWATTYQLYKYSLEANQKYTFDFMVNTYNNVNAFLIGENPFASGSMSNSSGSNTVIAAFQNQPISSLGYDEWHASRTQFTTLGTSTGRTLYVLVRGGYEDETFKFKLSKGYLSMEEETYNPYADSRIGFKWVTQWQTPLKLWK